MMDTMTGIGSNTKVGIKNRPFYHLPPTAVSIKGIDVKNALQALLDPKNASEQFTKALAHRTGNPNCFLTDSGRSALYIILLTIKNLSKRNKVIIPAYSCPTVVQAVLKAGLHPIFCDIEEETLGMDRGCLKVLIDEQTLAIVPTYLYGLPHDITDLIAIGHALGVFIIEDATQAFGAEMNGKLVGTIGDFGFYSMGRGKCIPTGHGGIIVTGDPFAAELDNTIKVTLTDTAYPDLISFAGYLGYGLATTPFGWWFIVHSPLNPANSGMDPAKLPPIQPGQLSSSQAGIGASILNRLDQINTARLQNALVLTEIMCQLRFITRPQIQPYSQPVFLRFPFIVKDKVRADKLFRLLSKAGIGVSRSYTRTLPDIYSGRDSGSRIRYPMAEHFADCLLTLPTHRLSNTDIVQIESAFSIIDTA